MTPAVTLFGRILREAAAELPDRELLRRFATSRDQAAFTTLLDRHGGMVRGVCLRVTRNAADAEDAAQAVFLVLARKAATLSHPEAVAAWLFGVARRVAAQARRSTAVRRRREAATPPKGLTSPADTLSLREALEAVDAELQRLPGRHRAPLVMCYWEGQTQAEAAHQLGWSASVLRGRLDRGRERLRQRLVRRGLDLTALLAADLLVQSSDALAASAALVPAAGFADTV